MGCGSLRAGQACERSMRHQVGRGHRAAPVAPHKGCQSLAARAGVEPATSQFITLGGRPVELANRLHRSSLSLKSTGFDTRCHLKRAHTQSRLGAASEPEGTSLLRSVPCGFRGRRASTSACPSTLRFQAETLPNGTEHTPSGCKRLSDNSAQRRTKTPAARGRRIGR